MYLSKYHAIKEDMFIKTFHIVRHKDRALKVLHFITIVFLMGKSVHPWSNLFRPSCTRQISVGNFDEFIRV